MTSFKCTSINDIRQKYSNQPSNLVTIKEIISPNESIGQAGLWQVTIPYVKSAQCPSGYGQTGFINTDSSIQCGFQTPSGWKMISNNGTTYTYQLPDGSTKTVKAMTIGSATIGYQTFTEGGSCISVDEYKNSNKYNIYPKSLIFNKIKSPLTTSQSNITSQPITRTSSPIITTTQLITRTSVLTTNTSPIIKKTTPSAIITHHTLGPILSISTTTTTSPLIAFIKRLIAFMGKRKW